MTAMGHKQTFAGSTRMSALPPKADSGGTRRHVCFRPEPVNGKIRLSQKLDEFPLKKALAILAAGWIESPYARQSLTFDMHEFGTVKRVDIGQCRSDCIRDLDLSRDAAAFHATRHVYGIAPYVNRKF